jgi:hypothetical protein
VGGGDNELTEPEIVDVLRDMKFPVTAPNIAVWRGMPPYQRQEEHDDAMANIEKGRKQVKQDPDDGIRGVLRNLQLSMVPSNIAAYRAMSAKQRQKLHSDRLTHIRDKKKKKKKERKEKEKKKKKREYLNWRRMEQAEEEAKREQAEEQTSREAAERARQEQTEEQAAAAAAAAPPEERIDIPRRGETISFLLARANSHQASQWRTVTVEEPLTGTLQVNWGTVSSAHWYKVHHRDVGYIFVLCPPLRTHEKAGVCLCVRVCVCVWIYVLGLTTTLCFVPTTLIQFRLDMALRGKVAQGV